MTEKYEDDIHNVTPERLDEMLNSFLKHINEVIIPNFDSLNAKYYYDEWRLRASVIEEAARRLRERPKATFIYEQ